MIKGIYQSVGESTETLKRILQLEVARSFYSSVISPITSLGGKAFKSVGDLVKILMSSNGGMIKTHSEGDLITNGSPGKEYILNSAQHGEFIVNRESTSQHLGLLRAINADKNGNLKIKQNADGGLLSMSSLGLMTDMTAFMSSPLTQMIILHMCSIFLCFMCISAGVFSTSVQLPLNITRAAVLLLFVICVTTPARQNTSLPHIQPN